LFTFISTKFTFFTFCSTSLIDILKRIKEDIQACKLYLKTDFKLHLDLDDQCADHCVRYALSDPNDVNLQAVCTHKHDMKCDRCELLPLSIIKLKGILSELQGKYDFTTKL